MSYTRDDIIALFEAHGLKAFDYQIDLLMAMQDNNQRIILAGRWPGRTIMRKIRADMIAKAQALKEEETKPEPYRPWIDQKPWIKRKRR